MEKSIELPVENVSGKSHDFSSCVAKHDHIKVELSRYFHRKEVMPYKWLFDLVPLKGLDL